MGRFGLKITILMLMVLLQTIIQAPGHAQADWPPFNFRLSPSYDNGKITYNIEFSNEVDWLMTNLVFQISPPEGTRFLEAHTQPISEVSFDGAVVTFFTAALTQPIKEASFVVEVTDPAKTIFTTHAWISWQGEEAGDYLTQDVSIDITRRPLKWPNTPTYRLGLRARASVLDGFIIYDIYPTNDGRLRMWDVKINVPVSPETTFLSAEASPPFVTNFDGREVSFFAMELERQVEIPPLRFKVAVAEPAPPLVVTHAWATWKNAGRLVGRSIPLQEETRGGDIIVQPNVIQQVVSDRIEDVPFAGYDITSVAIQNEGSDLKISLYTLGELPQLGEPFRFEIYVDQDCRTDTGEKRLNVGGDYLLTYKRDSNRADFSIWNAPEQKWTQIQPLNFNIFDDEKGLVLWIPQSLLENSQQFCWQIRVKYATDAFSTPPPNEITTSARYEAQTMTSEITASQVVTSSLLPPALDNSDYEANNSVSNQVVEPSSVSTTGNFSGKLAMPLDNSQTLYNVHIFSLPDGQELTSISHARQPNFRFDGQRLLVNQEGGGEENLYEYNLVDGTKRQVSDAPEDSSPYYDSWGNRVVYGNANLIIGAKGTRQPFIFVQCGLLPPHLESEPRCKNIPSLGVLVPAGQMGEIQGTNPVWTSNDMIVYKGCNTWAGARLCGIYSVPAVSTKGLGDGFIPRQLTSNPNDIPSDTKGNRITFTSNRDGNWEAYLMDLNGAGVINLSTSPDSNDGLPTISPDGQWVAFVSDRAGNWAVWVTPAAGGTPQKLFDLPTTNPWGEGDRAWFNERISWGP